MKPGERFQLLFMGYWIGVGVTFAAAVFTPSTSSPDRKLAAGLVVSVLGMVICSFLAG